MNKPPFLPRCLAIRVTRSTQTTGNTSRRLTLALIALVLAGLAASSAAPRGALFFTGRSPAPSPPAGSRLRAGVPARPKMAPRKPASERQADDTRRDELNIERRNHAAVALGNGKVLVIGGENNSGLVKESELFDVESRSFSPSASLITARADEVAIKLADGRVMVIGGRGDKGSLKSTEIYDGASNSFTSGPRMMRARAGHTATLLSDGKVLVVGGDAEGSAEIFEPSAGRFALIAARLNTPRAFHSAALLKSGQVLIAGGRLDGAAPEASAEIFDPETLSLSSTRSSMRAARVRPTLRVLPDGKVQVIGGDDQGSMEMYNAEGRYFTARAQIVPDSHSQNGVSEVLRSKTRAALINKVDGNITEIRRDRFPGLSALMESTGPLANLLDRSEHTLTEIPEAGTALVAGGMSGGGKTLKSMAALESSGATVTTDKTDYAPGETVIISGEGWLAGETVGLTIHRDNGAPDTLLSAVADATGNIQNSDFVIQESDLGVAFLLTALGQTSGYTAQTTFTDGNVKANWVGLPSGSTINVNWEKFTTGTSCTGTPSSSGTQAVDKNPTQGDQVGSAGNSESLKMTAPPVSGFVFVGWSACASCNNSGTATFTTTGFDICVAGFAQGTQTYTATYAANAAPTCNAGGPYSSTCRTASINGATASDANGDALSYSWASSNANVTVSPASGNIAAGSGTRTVPTSTATLASNVNPCNVSATLTLTVNDGHGGTSTCTATVTFNDTTPPQITSCPAAVTVQCASQVPAAATTYAGFVTEGGSATDNCTASGSLTVSSSDVVTPGSCANRFTITRTYTLKDSCNNPATCTQTITVNDQTPPTITGFPANTTVSCASEVPPANDSSVTATDNCAGTVTITHDADMITNQTCANRYTITRTYHATDVCGNVTSQSQTITVNDQTPPTITGFPANATVSCASEVPPANDSSVTATDNCAGTVTITHDADVITNQTCANRYTITRTYHATDVCGNVTSRSQTIAVNDQTPPTITCPSNTTIDCTASIDPSNTGTATATDNCSGVASITHTDAITPGNCAGNYTITRTWTATDGCGNSSQCVQTIHVQDTHGPTITCPTDTTIDCTASTDPSNTGTATAVDDCSGVASIVSSDAITPGNCAGNYTITRTWTATDGCGNSSQCVQTIHVQDTHGPTITCPSDTTIDCTASTDPSNTGTATAVDDCSGVASITHSDVVTAGNCAGNYTITRTWTATDGCGNPSQCVQTIHVQDTHGPTISCPPNTTIDCTASTNPSNTGTATATDDCSGVASITHTDATAPGNCAGNYTITRTWTATDNCGNASSCTQTVTVTDTHGPTISCPSNTTIDCTASTNPTNTGTATATDDCSGVASITHSDAITPGNCAGNYTITRTWTATDGCGNSSQCVQTIHVQDTHGPTITCPSNTTIDCTASSNPSNTGTATATDDCSGVASITHTDAITPGNCAGNYTITRTWTATDNCGNPSQCVQTIHVQDTHGPTITCPTDTTIDCTASTDPSNTGTATAVDDCSGVASIVSSDAITPGNCAGNYTITRTWTATDGCGNPSQCVQTIHVQDTHGPTITCPSDTTIDCTASTDPSNTGTATAVDDCSGVASITHSDVVTAGNCAGNYTITRTWTATDGCGNPSQCVQTIHVQDTHGPTISCPPNTTIDCTASTNPSNTGTATATDDCSGVASITHTDATAPGNCAGNYTITRTWTATDNCGNASSCTQTVTVTDTHGPTISCPSNTTIDCTASTNPTNTGAATATDDCSGVASITHSDAITPGNCAGNYTITRTWTATDNCGNSSQCVQTIHVQDTHGPIISCPANTTIDCTASSDPSNTGTATATDDCSGVASITHTDAITPGNCAGNYTITRTWSATDGCGNSSQCVQTIHVQDTHGPVITCPANTTIDCTEPTDPSNTGTATASDDCSGVASITHADATAPGNCAGNYTITRTWTATDGCGNPSQCIQTIHVQDTHGPIITCPSDTTIDCNASADPSNTGTATASDDCSGVALITHSDVVTAGNCTGNYTITRTWTATDGCGNSSQCVQTIHVQDTHGPTITCPANTTIDCAASHDPSNTGTATASDDCSGVASITHTDATTPGNCAGNYTITRTWTATDNCGNSSSCTQTVSVTDTHGPTITCPANTTIDCTASHDPSNTGTATASDDCSGVASITHTDAITPGNCAGNYTITRTWTATDNCGTPSSCTQTITVTDSHGPVITCPPNALIDCTASSDPSNTGTATATDDCSGVASITHTDAVTPGNCAGNYTITRTWSAADGCGNRNTCTQTITVTDTHGPTIACPPNTTIDCTASTNPSNTGTATASDDCSGVASITHSDVVTAGNCAGNYTITRTWTAADNCGNTSSCTQTVTVTDTTPPVITCPPDRVLACGDSNAPANTGTATATDNCSTPVTITYTDVSTPANCTGQPGLDRTWTATDACGNMSTCVQHITFADTAPPVITCPPDRELACGDSNAPANTGTATATDNCGQAVTITYTDVTTPANCTGQPGLDRTWKATDRCNNMSTCVQHITFVDTTPPVITCPADKQLQCNASTAPSNTGTATATDNCGQAVTITYTDASTASNCTGKPGIDRTWKATDACGNMSTCVQHITFVDTTPPAITCPPNKALQCNESTAPANTGIATGTDNCGGTVLVTFTDAPTATNCTGRPGIDRTWKATDGCGNMSTCVQHITFVDTTPPAMTCPTNVTLLPPGPGQPGVATYVTPTATDNCDPNPTESCTPPSGSTFPVGTTTVSCTATDACGNSRTCTFKVIVPVCVTTVTVEANFTRKGSNTANKAPVTNARVVMLPKARVQAQCNLLDAPCVWTNVATINNPPDPVFTTGPDGSVVVYSSVPDPNGWSIYIDMQGAMASGATVTMGTTKIAVANTDCAPNKRFTAILVADSTGTTATAMTQRQQQITGSLLEITYPEQVEWDGTDFLYPFIFTSDSDWEVDVCATVPQGYRIRGNPCEQVFVANETKVIFFDVEDIGSPEPRLQVRGRVKHHGRTTPLDFDVPGKRKKK